MNTLYRFAVAFGLLSACGNALAADRLVDHFPQSASSGCMACHGEIELIRAPESQMMQQIIARGEMLGDPAVVSFATAATRTKKRTRRSRMAATSMLTLAARGSTKRLVDSVIPIKCVCSGRA